MSNIQRVSEANVHFRSYQYDWGTRQLTTDASATQSLSVYSYNFHGV